MGELTVKAFLSILKELVKERGNEVYDYKIVIGDDEELNGVHQSYFCQGLTDKDVKNFKECGCDYHNELNTKVILIS